MLVVDGVGLASWGGEVATGWSAAAVLCSLDPSLGRVNGVGDGGGWGCFFL